MSSRRPGFVRRLEAWLLLPLGAVIRRLPIRWHVRLGYGLGSLAYRVDRKHRQLAGQNIQAALGCDDQTAARITRGSFRHFGRLLVEVLASESYARPAADGLFDVEGLDHLEKAYAQGRGVLVFSAHIGNWELVALRQAMAGFPMDLIARPLDNPWIEDAFVRWRESTGNRVLGKRGALRQALRTLKHGRGLAILIDQNVHTLPRIFVPFFSRPASTTPTLGSLAVRRGAPIVPVVSIPKPEGGYRIVYQPPLPVPEHGEIDERIRDVTLRATERIEEWIRATPETWLWLHNRWKSQPRADLGETEEATD